MLFSGPCCPLLPSHRRRALHLAASWTQQEGLPIPLFSRNHSGVGWLLMLASALGVGPARNSVPTPDITQHPVILYPDPTNIRCLCRNAQKMSQMCESK
jgi:hypothetical protein